MFSYRLRMTALALSIGLASVGGFATSVLAEEDVAATVRGIPLDTPWKTTIYTLARTTFVHPAWGWQHSERNYLLARKLARIDRLTIETDVQFAAAFLHDMAAFAPFEQPGVEHGARAAQTSEGTLRAAGFPMAKFPAVAAAERAHMFYSPVGTASEARVLHDADSLDFLGAIGAARMLALVGEKTPDLSKTIATLRTFARDIPPKLVTQSGRKLGVERAAELTAFLDRFDAESAAVAR